MEKGDIVVVIGILVVFVAWLLLRFRSWLLQPPKKSFQIPAGGIMEDHEAVELLEGAGFDILTGLTKIPVTVEVNDSIELKSRLTVDCFVQKNEQLFLVKIARDHEPIEMTGPGLTEFLLSYSLLYPEAVGVLYVDTRQQKIKKITFHIEV